MTSLEDGKNRPFNKIIENWVMNCTCIVDNWHVSNAVITLATVLATIPVLFFCQYAQVQRTGTFSCCRYRCANHLISRKQYTKGRQSQRQPGASSEYCIVGIPHNTAIKFWNISSQLLAWFFFTFFSVTSGYAMVVHGRPQTTKNTSFLGVIQPPWVAQPLYSRGHN